MLVVILVLVLVVTLVMVLVVVLMVILLLKFAVVQVVTLAGGRGAAQRLH